MPLEKLPEGYKGAPMSGRSDPDEDLVKQQDKPDESVVDMITSAPGNIVEAFSGEGVPIEFPQIPELSDMGSDAPGFFEGFLPRIKIMMARDDVGKTEIIHDAFKDDPRYGGKYSDKYGFPIIVWNNVPYYVNKPGAGLADLNTLLGEIIRFIPASKFVSGAKTVRETVGRGVVGYGGTEAATLAGEAIITPEAVAAKDRGYADAAEQIGTSTAIGIGADSLAPPVGKALVRGVRAGARGASKTGRIVGEAVEPFLPRFSFDVIQESKYPLTQGQRTAQLPEGVTPRTTEQLASEEMLRRAPGIADEATNVIRGFDERQLTEIRNDALELQEEFGAGVTDPTGIYGNIPSVAAEQAQGVVSTAADRLKGQSKELYDALQDAQTPPVMTPDGVIQVTQELLDIVPTILRPNQIMEGPLKREMVQLRRLQTLARNPRFKDQSLKNIHGYQKRLRTAINQAEKGSPEELALIQMKTKLDEAVYDGIERGFITGDQEVLDQLQQATGLYADYMTTIGRGVGRNKQEVAANRILDQLSNNAFTPVQVTNLLFGQNRFNPNQAVGVVLDKLKKSLDPDEYDEFAALLKDGILTKAFAGKGGEITRKSIVENYNDVFFKNRAIIDRLFTPDEIARIKEFRANVLPTLWAEVKSNPSGSAVVGLTAFAKFGMLNSPGKTGQVIAKKAFETLEAADQASAAQNAVRQTLDRFQAPLLSDTMQSAIRTSLMTETGEDEISDAERAKLLEAIESCDRKQNAAPAPTPLGPTIPTETSIFDPLPVTPATPMGDPSLLGPSVLPRAADREIAARRSGIAGLV